MPRNRVSAVPVKNSDCRPFILEVMVFSPESGYKFELLIERQCATSDESIWKLVFDLFKKDGDSFIQIVHVSFTAGTKTEAKGIDSMATDGVSFDAAKVIINDVHPAAKALEDNQNPTKNQKDSLRKSMSKAAKSQVVSLDL